MRTTTWRLRATLLLFLAPASQGQAPAARTPAATATVARLEATIPELMKKGEVPGLQVALLEHGRTIWLGNFGVKNAANGQAVTNETVFEAASLSKTVFAYAVLKLVDEGRLGLDTPLTTYLPKPYVEGDDRLERITARIVLSHRTGFRNWRGDDNLLKINFTPGERFSYSGEGFVYLAKVVEQIAGKPLNQYMTEAVFTPLGMNSSSYLWLPDYDRSSATGHDASGQPQELYKPKTENAASSLHTTARDYAVFLEAVLNGRGLKPATLRQMETHQVAVDPACTNCTAQVPKELSKDIFWGLGWGITRTDQGEALWHWGDNGSFKCFVAIYPKLRKGVVLFANSENGLGIAEDVVQEAIGSDLPVFGWLKYERYDSASRKFWLASRDHGATAAIREFDQDLAAGTIDESSINSTGYRLLAQKKNTDALAVFELNVKLHPDSWNAYDSLGEAYLNTGDPKRAEANYQRSLQLNPGNTGAAEALKKLAAN